VVEASGQAVFTVTTSYDDIVVVGKHAVAYAFLIIFSFHCLIFHTWAWSCM